MTKTKGFQPIYENGEAYENFIYCSDIIYMEESHAIKEIKERGYTEHTREDIVYDGDIKNVDIYRFSKKEQANVLYRENEFAYVREVEVVNEARTISTLIEELTHIGYHIRDIEHPSLEVTKVQVPYLNQLNDYMVFYITSEKGSEDYSITDDGYTLNELVLDGVTIGNHKALVNSFLSPIDIQITDKREVMVEATKDNLMQKLHHITQAVIQMNVLSHIKQVI